MTNSLLESLAWTVGGGFAAGLGVKAVRNSTAQPRLRNRTGLGIVLERIEMLETQIDSVESSQAQLAGSVGCSSSPSPCFRELEERVTAHGGELDALRAAVRHAADADATRIDRLKSAIDNLQTALPGFIEQSMQPKLEAMQLRMRTEIQETSTRTLVAFSDRIQANIVDRISGIEENLNQQSETIRNLHSNSLQSSRNLQALVAGVENLARRVDRQSELPVAKPRPAIVPPAIVPRPDIKALLAQKAQRDLFRKAAMAG